MKAPVPLGPEDDGAAATVLREFEEAELGDRGYAQFFYHHGESVLPVRDVTDTAGEGEKLEPCIERKAENYCTRCIQRVVGSFATDPERRYLFLFTRCRNEALSDHYWTQYIIGYIDKRRALRMTDPHDPEDTWIACQGPIKLVPFDHGFPLRWIDRPDLPYFKNLDADQTWRVLEHLSEAENIYGDCLERVKELEASVDRPRIWEQPAAVAPDGGAGPSGGGC